MRRAKRAGKFWGIWGPEAARSCPVVAIEKWRVVAIERFLENLPSEPKPSRRYKKISGILVARRHLFFETFSCTYSQKQRNK